MRRRVSSTERAARNTQMKDLHAVAAAFAGFRPGSEVFTRVRAVPTIFVQFDHGVRVGGLPTERIALVHGPSGEGKTYFTLGLAASFLRLLNPVFFVDAERTLEDGFVRLALGEYADSPLWMGDKPTSYEATRVAVRKFCNTTAKLRKDGKIHRDACGLVIVDSIRKLVPEDQWKKILELAKVKPGDKEKARDRSAQIKAMMNAAWCDELIPLLEQTGCTMVIIARESDDPDADARTRMFGGGYKTGGGKALYYDASLDIRIERAKYVTKEAKEEDARPHVYGERHRITIKKSKVSGKEDKAIVAYFHSSNGKLIPEGLDPARDLVELGIREGVIKGGKKDGAKKSGGKAPKKKGAGGWMQWGSHKWQGEHAAVRKLASSPALLLELDAAVRAKFANASPIEIGPHGEVISGDEPPPKETKKKPPARKKASAVPDLEATAAVVEA